MLSWEQIEKFFSGAWWAMVISNPLPFLVAALFGVILTSWYYRERMNVYEQRIVAYKERLGEAPKETPYTHLTNGDIKQETYRMVSRLRNAQQKDLKATAQLYAALQQFPGDASAEEKIRTSQANTANLAAYYNTRNANFQKDFSGNILAIRSELALRLSPEHLAQLTQEQQHILVDTLATGFLAGVDPIGNIANDLEHMANLLPTEPLIYRWSVRWQDTVLTLSLFLLVGLLLLRHLILFYRTLRP